MLRPAFKPHLSIQPVQGDGHYLIAELEGHVLEGALINAVVPLINGQRTSEEIALALQPTVPTESTISAIEYLAQCGHLVESDPTVPVEFSAYWSSLGQDYATVHERALQYKFGVVSVTAQPAVGLEQLMMRSGFQMSSTPNFLVVIADDYLDPRLQQINAHCLATQTLWLVAKPSGAQPWIGPFFIPGQAACMECLRHRLLHNRQLETYVAERQGRVLPLPIPHPTIPLVEEYAYSHIVLQLMNILANTAPAGVLTAIECRTMQTTQHPVLRRPQCPACGSAEIHSGAHGIGSATVLLSGNSEAGDRKDPPDVTYQRYSHHVSPITGLVRDVIPSFWNSVTPLRSYTAGLNFSLRSKTSFMVKHGLRTMSSGKGRTDSQARTGALCEALERYSGLHQPEDPIVRTSLADLGETGIDPNSVMLFSEKQFRDRDQWIKRGSRFQLVPTVTDRDTVMDWSPVYSVTNESIRYLPTSYLYYSYESRPGEEFYTWSDSNGNAAGASFEDACLQAIYELIERDSVAIWWYNRLNRPGIDLESFRNPFFSELLQFYAESKREIWALDITSDLGIPSVAAFCRRTDSDVEDIVMGFGAHSSLEVATERALTEVNQFMPAVMNVVDGKTMYLFDDPDSLKWWQEATFGNQPYIQPSKKTVTKAPEQDFKRPKSINEHLRTIIGLLESRGMEVMILDQTRADVGLPVVKVIVPGMRHFWARLAPGRLYDVPVQMGELERPIAEEDLNPIAMFL